ncbi:MAG: orotidine-5'-phosphate decarboxylase [Firmicutes bacterium]|nr:orotidine-5'-phosphate decarboxylase [Bacillota bacterium]
MNGFQKLEALIKKKQSHLVLGLDPTDEEIKIGKDEAGLEAYLKTIIDQCAEYIVAVKPQLAFYEHSAAARQVAMNLMAYASEKHGLVKILDVKRGDIANTQTSWAKADIQNFKPDIVVLNAYMGGEDVIKPYLQQDPNLCVYALVATSNPSAIQFQETLNGGLFTYQQMALQARQIDVSRVGYVIGSTKTDAIKNVRMLEVQKNLPAGHALCPGFGRQGGSLEFALHGGQNAIYPISSGLTKKDHLVKKTGKTPFGDTAKHWRDEINKQKKKSIPPISLTKHVVDLLNKDDLILTPKSADVATWPLLKRGRDTLKQAGIALEGDDKAKLKTLQKALKDGVLTEADFGKIFLQLRDVMAAPEARRLMAYLYAEMIIKSGVKFDAIGAIAYGAINTGDLVSYILDKPAFLLRKERGAESTHSDVLGRLKKGDKVIMIEDVTTTATSLISDIKMLRQNFGVTVEHAFIFVKRTPESEKACLDNGIKLHYILDMEGLKKILDLKF